MKTIKSFFLLTLLMPLLGQGQSGNVVILTISTSEEYHTVYEIQPLQVQNIVNTIISGQYESNQSVLIRPKVDTSIKIVDPIAIESIRGGGGGTTIRSRPPIGPRLASTSTSMVTIFPNPVEKELSFQLNNQMVVGFSIFDLSGKNKMEEKIEPSTQHKLDVSALESGHYILQLNTEKNQTVSIQFIKK